MGKSALIFGVTGQDGSYLAELLLSKGYEVVGVKRRTSTDNIINIENVKNDDRFTLVEGDITDPSSVHDLIFENQPDECYNLAAMSHVGTSFIQPSYTMNVNANGVLNILEQIRKCSLHTKFYQASTSELFGDNYTIIDGKKMQNENTAFSPNSPYAIAKLAAHNLVRVYRAAYGIYGCCGILHNHESPRRGTNFVTRKITKWIGNYYRDSDIPKLKLGNLSSYRDFGYAADYVKAMHLMLQQPNPDDYVVATGNAWSILEFAQEAFRYAGLNLGEHVEIDSALYRPCEVPYLQGDATKIRSLGWKPSINIQQLVRKMVDYDINHG